MFRRRAHDEEIKKGKGNPYCGKQDVRMGVHPPSHEAYPLLSTLLPFLSPSLLSPLPFPSFASLLYPFRPFPPLIPATGAWGRYSSPSGSGRNPAAKRILVQFTAQNLQIS